MACLSEVLPVVSGPSVCAGPSVAKVCARLRSEFHGADIPIIVTTRHEATESEVLAFIEAGASDHMVKPYSPAELAARVLVHAPHLVSPTAAANRSIETTTFGALPVSPHCSACSWCLPCLILYAPPVLSGRGLIVACAAADSDGASNTVEQLESLQAQLQAGDPVVVDDLTVLLVGVRSLSTTLSTLGLQSVSTLMRTWHTQCAALSHSAPVILFSSGASEVRRAPLQPARTHACM